MLAPLRPGQQVAELGGAIHRDLFRWLSQLLDQVNKTTRYGTAAPASGIWAVGDIVWNSSPSIGQPIGWTCTAAGSPGTWRGFGVVV